MGNVDNVVELAGLLGCETSSLPLKCLGLHLGAHFKTKSSWDGIVEKFDRHLASWKIIYLSKDGRVTLIKNTLSQLTYVFLVSFSHSSYSGKSYRENSVRFSIG
jgi:hypothetical protein